MSVKKKYKEIEELEKSLNEIIRVIEIIDPIRNDTKENHFKDRDGQEMVRIPRFKCWLVKSRKKLVLKVQRLQAMIQYEPIEIELGQYSEVLDSISKGLCEKRDWYRGKIKEIDNEQKVNV